MKTLFKVNILAALLFASLGVQAQFYNDTNGYTEFVASTMGYPSQNQTFCDGVDRPNQQADCKFKTWDKLPDGTPTPGVVKVKKAPTVTGTPDIDLKNDLNQAGLSNGLLNALLDSKARLVEGYFKKNIAEQAGAKNTISNLKSRSETYTGTGTVINTIAQLNNLRSTIAQNHTSMTTYIFRGTIDINQGNPIEVGSNTTLIIDGIILYDKEIPNTGASSGTPLGEKEGGIIEIVGLNNNSRKNNVKIIGTKRGQLEYKRQVGNAIYAEFVNDLEINGVEMYNCYNSLHLKQISQNSIVQNNVVMDDGRRAIHMKVCRDLVIKNNLVFNAWQDGVDIDAFTERASVIENLFIKSGNRFMAWTEVSASNNLIENNVGIHYEGDDSNGGFSENGSNNNWERPTANNVWRYNHVFYPHDGLSGVKMRDQFQINRPSNTFFRNYVWTLTNLPWHNPHPHDNIKDDIFYLSKEGPVDSPFTISFVKPFNSQVFQVGTDLEVEVNANDENGSVNNVRLYLNNVLVRQINTAPYQWGFAGQNDSALTNMQEGTYELKAVASNNTGDTKETTITIQVVADTGPRTLNIEYLSVPAVFASDGAGNFGPALGQPNLIVKFSNVTLDNANITTAGMFSPIRLTSNVQNSLTGETITGPNVTSISNNPGAPNAGTPLFAPQGFKPGGATPSENYILEGPTVINNGDGTSDVSVTIAFYKWEGTYTNGQSYTIVNRWFSTKEGDADGLESIPVIDNGSGVLVVQGMVYDSSATLSNSVKNSINGLITSANPVEETITLSTNGNGASYYIANMLGAIVKKGTYAKNIDVQELSNGVYILVVREGVYKFVKK
ncbi:T9SS type A sorting domain-containing protein [Seonamhaeicola algicola]|uniref:T9SS type A sorting domain-containing protein n=1 Tax=Seonamhaeicola algicola TaxID=1719036 RepID=A0A5C7AQP9_9FLAO|nr:Ig-like domain-containing protein [Seonamhaeicola algicola]TXE09943.1 T9SS type A sorting domain-containing protein [Seonamhaeicola algicola]